jgi:prevent-host-death family protein
MARAIRRSSVRRVPLSEIKNDLSRFLREAEGEEIVITRNGKPAGVLMGFASEDDWLDYLARKRPALSAPHRAIAPQTARGPRRRDRGCRVNSPNTRNVEITCHHNPSITGHRTIWVRA